MARSAHKTSLETRTARARLRVRRAPYFVKIAIGLRLGYYRGSRSGSWIARRYRGAGAYDTAALGLADGACLDQDPRILARPQAARKRTDFTRLKSVAIGH